MGILGRIILIVSISFITISRLRRGLVTVANKFYLPLHKLSFMKEYKAVTITLEIEEDASLNILLASDGTINGKEMVRTRLTRIFSWELQIRAFFTT